MVTQHFAKFSVVHTAVGILMDNMFLCTSPGFRAILLLLGGPTKYQHNSWKNIIRQVQKSSLFLIIFHNITNVAGTDTKALRCHNCILCGNCRVCHRKHKVSYTWFSWLTASFQICIIPLLAVSTEYQYHRCFRNKWLVVAGLR